MKRGRFYQFFNLNISKVKIVSHFTYIINNCVYYRTSDSVLWSSSDTEEVKDIGVIPGRLLGYILRNTGRIISRDELLEHVWVHYGLRPSGASLNQHISIVRKSLVSLGIGEDFIRTVPKLGYMVDSSCIKEIENVHIMNEQLHSNVNVIQCNDNFKFLIIPISLLIFFITWLGINNFYTRNDPLDFKLYPLMNFKGCAVYSSKKGSATLNEFNKKFVSNILSETKCSEDSFYIFTGESSKLIENNVGGVFFAHCYVDKNNLNVISAYNSTYEQYYEKK